MLKGERRVDSFFNHSFYFFYPQKLFSVTDISPT